MGDSENDPREEALAAKQNAKIDAQFFRAQDEYRLRQSSAWMKNATWFFRLALIFISVQAFVGSCIAETTGLEPFYLMIERFSIRAFPVFCLLYAGTSSRKTAERLALPSSSRRARRGLKDDEENFTEKILDALSGRK